LHPSMQGRRGLRNGPRISLNPAIDYATYAAKE